MLTLLTSPPPALTQEELLVLSRDTPTTFEGIPPLLRHLESSIEFLIDPPFEGLSNGKGQLFITEGALSFWSPELSRGLSIPYQQITLHAISRAPLRPFSEVSGSVGNGGGGPCIYCQVDEEETPEGEIETREIILIPSDPTALDKIFETLSTCAALHPTLTTDDNSMFGLDPSSMVYADSDGNLAGPGMNLETDFVIPGSIETMTAEEESEFSSSAGRAAKEYLETITGPVKVNGNGK